MQQLIHGPTTHPQSCLAYHEFAALERREELHTYTVNDSSLESGHHGANRQPYTLFTQPLTHYASLVVQRLIQTSVDQGPKTYLQRGLDKMASHLNKLMDKAHRSVGHQPEFLKSTHI